MGMSKVDPTGFQAALATIQPGALSERQQRIAAGLALVRDGMPGYKAARQVGIPWSTLWGYIHNVSKLGNAESDGMESDIRALNEASVDVALIAAESVRDELVNNRDAWKPADLVRAYSAATDRVIALNQRSSQPNTSTPTLASLLSGIKLTVETSRAGDDATTVEAERVD